MKDFLVERGFTEISTQSFATKGDTRLANPLDVEKPYLRVSLAENMKEAVKHATYVAPLLGLASVKLFEVGTVFPKSGERIEVATSEPVDVPTIKDDNAYAPKRYTLGAYKPFSIYPFVLRDIAVWVPDGVEPDAVRSVIQAQATDLLVRTDLFDSFSKGGQTSYAFHLVFQSMDRTLSDAEVGAIMDSVTAALNAKDGWKVR